MRAVVITASGALQIEDRPTPEPTGDQIVVRVRAAGLNRADLLQARGQYPAPPGVPADIPGLEYAGEVSAIGPNVTRPWKVGDPVFGVVAGGGLAEYVQTHEQMAVLIPSELDWTQAGAVPEAFITALDALNQSGARPGQTVLIHAVGGGVGTAAAQLAHAMGCPTIGTSRTPEKLERAREDVGLDIGLSATPDDLADAIQFHTDGRGVAAVLDHLGGPYLNANLRCLAEQGTLVLIGLLAGRKAESLDLGLVLNKRLRVVGTVLRARPLDQKIAATRRFEQSAIPWLQRGLVRPILDQVFPLDQIEAAVARMESNDAFGKIVLTP